MLTVLVIDDEPAVRTYCCWALQATGFSAREAADGDAGVESYQHRPTDLVLCDLETPVSDGPTAIEKLRRAFPHAKIVAMSSGGFMWIARALHVSATLVKPFGYVELLAAVEEALGMNDPRPV